MTSRCISTGVFYSCCILSITILGWTQTGTGNIQGTVKDSSGAVIPKANVRLIQTATNRQYITETNDAGIYLFPALELGPYEITVEFSGMETWKGRLNLLAGQTADVEIVLTPGATSTTVNVAGDVAPLVTTTSPTLATVVAAKQPAVAENAPPARPSPPRPALPSAAKLGNKAGPSISGRSTHADVIKVAQGGARRPSQSAQAARSGQAASKKTARHA